MSSVVECIASRARGSTITVQMGRRLMRAARGVAFLVVVTAVWLAGFGSAFAGPSTGPSPSGTAVSSTPPASSRVAGLVGVAGH